MAESLAVAVAPAVASRRPRPAPLPDGAANLSRAGFIAAVERCLEYIAAGDIFQVQVSRRFAATSRCRRSRSTRRCGR